LFQSPCTSGVPERAASESGRKNLNHGVSKLASASGDNQSANVLFHQGDGLVVRAFTSDRYSRIWNYEVLDRLIPLQEYGWRVPPARPARRSQAGIRIATKADVLDGNKFGLSIKQGDAIAPAGLYASDHDMFVFMVNERNRVKDGTSNGLAKGFFVENSEVGAASLSLTTFFYRVVCGNHIVWGATDVSELRIRHVGFADTRYPAKSSLNFANTLPVRFPVSKPKSKRHARSRLLKAKTKFWI
jgi:uncharacterized protein DUF932